ncbi:MAG: hypothetical protein MI924_31000 [Chloroflexales bacterium]|nr:hypothetical protein [Chloroflexales bacterium]
MQQGVPVALAVRDEEGLFVSQFAFEAFSDLMQLPIHARVIGFHRQYLCQDIHGHAIGQQRCPRGLEILAFRCRALGQQFGKRTVIAPRLRTLAGTGRPTRTCKRQLAEARADDALVLTFPSLGRATVGTGLVFGSDRRNLLRHERVLELRQHGCGFLQGSARASLGSASRARDRQSLASAAARRPAT